MELKNKEYPKLANEILTLIEQNNYEFDTSVLALVNTLCIIFAAKRYEHKDDKEVDFDMGILLLIETLKREMPRISEEYIKIKDEGGNENELGSLFNR